MNLIRKLKTIVGDEDRSWGMGSSVEQKHINGTPQKNKVLVINYEKHKDPADAALKKMRVGVVGFGVVGSATAKGLQKLGNLVYINDVKNLEPHEEEFRIMKEYDLSKVDLTMLCLPTPTLYSEKGGHIDLSFLEQEIEHMGERLHHYHSKKGNHDYKTFVIRSTVIPGTTRKLGSLLEQKSKKKLGSDFGIAMNPEFLRAYNNDEDFLKPRATVIGQYDKRAGDQLFEAYKNLPSENKKIFRVSLEEAEMAKYAHNIYNAMKISAFNELHLMTEQISKNLHKDLSFFSRNGYGPNFERIRDIMLSTTEALWNPQYGTHAGVAYGGTCLPKDTNALLSFLREEHGIDPKVLAATIEINEVMKTRKNPEIIGKDYFQKRQHPSYDNLKY